jgi:hypothetical protein
VPLESKAFTKDTYYSLYHDLDPNKESVIPDTSGASKFSWFKAFLDVEINKNIPRDECYMYKLLHKANSRPKTLLDVA